MNRYVLIAFTIGVISSFAGGTLGMMAASPYTEDRTERVFVYATLTNPITRAFACWCRTKIAEARIEGYAKTIRNIIPAENSFVRGGIIMVSEAELARIDRYEGVPEKYRREQIRIDGRPAWVYIKNTGAEN